MGTPTTVTATPLRIVAEYRFRLAEPKRVSDYFGRTIYATQIEWRHYVDLGKLFRHFAVTAFTDDHDNVTIATDLAYVPDWVPRPQFDWDEAVIEFAEEHADEVSR